MISIREQSYGLNVALYNEFTLEDFQEFEAAALKCVEKVHRPDMLLDLSMLKDFTIDMAVEDLRRAGKPVDVDAVKSVIHDNPEWEAKLEREIFSDANIARAIAQTKALFQ